MKKRIDGLWYHDLTAVAERSGYHRHTIMRWCQLDELKGRKIRGRWWIAESVLSRFFAHWEPTPGYADVTYQIQTEAGETIFTGPVMQDEFSLFEDLLGMTHMHHIQAHGRVVFILQRGTDNGEWKTHKRIPYALSHDELRTKTIEQPKTFMLDEGDTLS